MELRNLRADIKRLEPASGLTVDDTLSIMQDLWGDILHESGCSVADSPVRDADGLAGKLIWACNQLVRITERHADELDGAGRLSRLQGKLAALQQQADAYEAAGPELQELREEKEQLEKRIEARQDEAERLKKSMADLLEEERRLEKDAAELRDAEAWLKKQIADLRAEKERLEKERQALDAENAGPAAEAEAPCRENAGPDCQSDK